MLKRLELAAAIEANRGYSSGYHDRFVLSWNVALYWVNLDKDHIYERVLKDHGNVPMSRKLDWNPDEMWNIVQEEMYDRLNDDDGNRTYSPDTAAKYGLTLDENYFEVNFELHGRSGKHLVVTKFEGVSLKRSARDFVDALRDDAEWEEFSEEWCTNLLAMIDEWDSIFTQKNASDQMEDIAAARMHIVLEEIDDAEKAREMRREVQMSEED